VDYPNNRIVAAEYDARGNLAAQTDSSHWRDLTGGTRKYATTRYERTDPDWPDFVTQVTLPEGEVTRIGYHASGNRAWQQPGDSTTHAVRFEYNALGLLEWIRLPATATQPEAMQRFEYDVRGNLEYGTTSLGLQSGLRTRSYNDDLGRTWKTESPIDNVSVATTVTTFDDAGRPKVVTSSAPMLHGAAPGQVQSAMVENHYDHNGNVLRVDRWSTPDPANVGVITTRWEYDAAGRAIREWAPDATPGDSTDNPVNRTDYDPAGERLRAGAARLPSERASAGRHAQDPDAGAERHDEARVRPRLHV
jgi:hypothetical protein